MKAKLENLLAQAEIQLTDLQKDSADSVGTITQ